MRTLRMAGLTVRLSGGSDREGGGSGPVVVLLHGYGAPGDDLVPLARVLRVPPDTRFVFPEAPLALPDQAAYGGRAWWQIDTLALQRAAAEGREAERARHSPQGLKEANEIVNAVLDAVERELGVDGERIVLGGFSQGAMLSCDVALRSDRKLAGLALLSTTLLCQDEWSQRMPARTDLPVLLAHGLADPLLSHNQAVALRELLRSAGLNVRWLEFRGGHEIPNPALEALQSFIAQCLEPRPAQ